MTERQAVDEARYYYADTDDLGVLCVDQLADCPADEEVAADLAAKYPDTIYFRVDLPGPSRDGGS